VRNELEGVGKLGLVVQPPGPSRRSGACARVNNKMLGHVAGAMPLRVARAFFFALIAFAGDVCAQQPNDPYSTGITLIKPTGCHIFVGRVIPVRPRNEPEYILATEC
jgi:hypothetical protein